MNDLTIFIPARNEEFLKETVEDILKNKRAKTDIIVTLDGDWNGIQLEQHPDVNVIYYPQSIGQRAIANQCVKLSRAKYVMKVDAHCSFDESFDVKMIEAFKEVGDNVVMAPAMKNLHCFDWKCYKCGKRTYQDTGDICPVDGEKMRKKMVWQPRRGTFSVSYCFSAEPKFGYFSAHKEKQVGNIVESMSLQGSSFMCTREKYWDLNICDEEFGSWGSQGIEVACKFWLSGGRVLINKNTWYAHMFRTKAVFGFPYDLSGRQVQHAKNRAKDLFFNKRWDKQVKPLSWLIEKFWPIPGWEDKDLQDLKTQEASN